MSSLKLLPILILFNLFDGDLIAQTSSIFPITSVDLYQSGAIVHHSDSVYFEGAIAEIVIDGIASNINPQSFQVNLPNGIILEDLDFEIVNIEDDYGSDLKSVNDSIASLTFQIEMYESLINTLNEEREFLQANRKIGSNQEVLLVDDLIEMADFLRERHQDLGLEIIDIQMKIANIKDVLRQLKAKKSLINELGLNIDGRLTLNLLNVSANNRTEYIIIKYLTSEASWTTNYNFYLEDGEVNVKRQANIQQNSGIDWNYVNVKLISGDPEQSIKPNDIRDWFIEECVDMNDLVEEINPNSIISNKDSLQLNFDKSIPNAGNIRYRFEVLKPVNLSSSLHNKSVEVDQFSLDGVVEYYASPSQNSSAYAIIKCSDWADKKLMNGRVDVVSSNKYLGWYNLRLPIMGDTLHVNLGHDPNVMCYKELLSESSTVKRFAGKKQVTQTWELTVENSHSNTVFVNLVDKLPRTNNSEITISALTDDSGIVDLVSNEISFDFELSPFEKRIVTYVLTVTYPGSMNLENF
ncbi:MAG: hypothetical protein CL850_03195 [Crocinitomicaceae bacterium]|nr:hypothetical protein [Crocinitomicaceae bacterium]